MNETIRFDYIIVGAGSAGCTLANRLSEGGDASVLLLEAGGWDRDPLIHVPLGWGKILQKRLHDWNYFCEPEDNVDGRTVECARGKVVGGSSSVNAMAYVRGNRRDYDRWAENGLSDWGYDRLLPYFRKQEAWEGGADTFRGGDGPIKVQSCKYADPLVEAFGTAGRTAGHTWTDDYNGAVQEGFGRLQMTIADGRRASGATAYLRPVLRRANLRVEVKAQATKVLLEGNRAVGVAFSQGGESKVAHAEREVILAGGVINSPQLLMLSGIGSPEELRRHGIDVAVDLPGVGQNLQDHVSVILMYSRTQPGPFHRAMRYDRIALSMVQAYLFGSGFAGDVPGGTVAFLKSDSELDRPDVQLLFTAAPLGAWPYFAPFIKPFQDGFACRIVMLHPQSRGRVELASADPMAMPLIRQNFLDAPQDWQTTRQALRMARDIMAQPALKAFIKAEFAPGPENTSDADLDAYIRASAITVHHPLGTCRMGVASDPLAVVDQKLCVRHVAGLRVVDGSVMPEMTSGNINAPIVAIAERAADLIRGRPPLAPAGYGADTA